MKKIINVLLIIMIIFLISPVSNVYAKISTDILSDSFVDEFRLDDTTDSEVSSMVDSVLTRVTPIINKVLSLIQVFGVILTVIAVAFFGFSIIMSNSDEFLEPLAIKGGLFRDKDAKKTPSDERQLRKWMWVVLIGAILLFLGSTIVKIVFKVLSI